MTTTLDTVVSKATVTAPFPAAFSATTLEPAAPDFRITMTLASGPVLLGGPFTVTRSRASVLRPEPRRATTKRFVRWSSFAVELIDGAALVSVADLEIGAGSYASPSS